MIYTLLYIEAAEVTVTIQQHINIHNIRIRKTVGGLLYVNAHDRMSRYLFGLSQYEMIGQVVEMFYGMTIIAFPYI